MDGEPGGLESIGSQRVGHNYSDLAHMQAILIKNNEQCAMLQMVMKAHGG